MKTALLFTLTFLYIQRPDAPTELVGGDPVAYTAYAAACHAQGYNPLDTHTFFNYNFNQVVGNVDLAAYCSVETVTNADFTGQQDWIKLQ